METESIRWAMCLDCDWQGDVKECDNDFEYDEFYGKDYPYPICPECSGGVEVSNLTEQV